MSMVMVVLILLVLDLMRFMSLLVKQMAIFKRFQAILLIILLRSKDGIVLINIRDN